MKKTLFIFLASLFSLHAFNQEKVKPSAKWNFFIEPYLMFPNMDGKVGLGSQPDVSVNANPSDIFNHLQMGAMLNMEASHNKWAISSDFIYMKLSQDVEPSKAISSGEVEMKQYAWELAGLYKVTPWLEAGIGGFLNSISALANINVNNIGGGTTNKNAELTKTWVDPMIIARIKSNPSQKFVYLIRGEIGGFGIASNFAWQLQAYAGYRFSRLFQITGGYRVIGLDYENGSGEDRFLYDMSTFGPVVRFGFNF